MFHFFFEPAPACVPAILHPLFLAGNLQQNLSIFIGTLIFSLFPMKSKLKQHEENMEEE
jgi:hypothetical protein